MDKYFEYIVAYCIAYSMCSDYKVSLSVHIKPMKILTAFTIAVLKNNIRRIH